MATKLRNITIHILLAFDAIAQLAYYGIRKEIAMAKGRKGTKVLCNIMLVVVFQV